jgi:hypothetical protein
MSRGLEYLYEEEDDEYEKFEKIQHRPKTEIDKTKKKKEDVTRREILERGKQKRNI